MGKGVRRHDTIAPELFTTALQLITRSLDWNEKGIRIGGKSTSNLPFTGQTVLNKLSKKEEKY